MVVKELLTILKDYGIRAVSLADGKASIYGILPYPHDPEEMVPNILYIASGDNDVSCPSGTDIMNILYFGKRSFGEEMDPSRVNLLQILSDENRERAVDEIRKKNTVDMRRHEAMRELTEALFENRGVQYILDKAYGILGNPVFAFGRSNSYILQTYDRHRDYSDCPAAMEANTELMRAAKDSLPADQLITKYILDRDTVRKIRETKGFVRHHNDNIGCDQLSMLIKVKGIEVGKLVLIAAAHPIEEIDELMFERLSHLLSHKSDNLEYP